MAAWPGPPGPSCGPSAPCPEARRVVLGAQHPVLAAGVPTVGVSVLGGVAGAVLVFVVAVLVYWLYCKSCGQGRKSCCSPYRPMEEEDKCPDVEAWTQGSDGYEGVDLGEIDISSPLGRGGFGMVYKGSLQGDTVALKVIEHDGKLLEGRKEPLEAVLSKRVDHPNVVKTILHQTRRRNSIFASLSATGDLLQLDEESATTGREQILISGLTVTPSTTDDFSELAAKMRAKAEGSADRFRTWIVMEYCDGGSLAKAIKRGVFFHEGVRSRPNMGHILLTAVEVARAVCCLHEQKIVHGDLKGQNILLKRAPEDARGFYCKVADFGLSRLVATNGHLETRTYGTVRYMPPELLRDGLLMPAADVYSFGVLLWQLVSGERPFPRRPVSDVMAGVINGKRPQIPACCPQKLAGLIADCWQHGYKRRPGFDQIVDRLTEMQANCDVPDTDGVVGLAMDEGCGRLGPGARLGASMDSEDSREGSAGEGCGGDPPPGDAVSTGFTGSSTTPEELTFGATIPDVGEPASSSWSPKKPPAPETAPAALPWRTPPPALTAARCPQAASPQWAWIPPPRPSPIPSDASSVPTCSTAHDDSARGARPRRPPISVPSRVLAEQPFQEEPASSRSDTASEFGAHGDPGARAPGGPKERGGFSTGPHRRACSAMAARSTGPSRENLLLGRGRSAGTRDVLRCPSPSSSQGATSTGSSNQSSGRLGRYSAGAVPFKRHHHRAGVREDRAPRGSTAPAPWRPSAEAQRRLAKQRGALRPRPATAPPRAARGHAFEVLRPIGQEGYGGGRLPRVQVPDALLDSKMSISAASTTSTYFSAKSTAAEDAGEALHVAIEV